MRIFRVVALLSGVLLAGCTAPTPSAAPSGEGGARPAVRSDGATTPSCRTEDAAFTFGKTTRRGHLTGVTLLNVADDGQRSTRVMEFDQLPSSAVKGAQLDGELSRKLFREARAVHQFVEEDASGPMLSQVDPQLDGLTTEGSYVGFTGVRVIDIPFSGTCSALTWSGTIAAWDVAMTGVLDCRLPHDGKDAVVVLAERFC